MINNLVKDIQNLIGNTNFGDNIINIKPNPNIVLSQNDIQFVYDIMKS